MPFVTRKSLLTLSILSGVAVVAVAGFVYSGIYNVGADDHHTRPVYALMESLRERSIEVRASQLTPPALSEQARIVQGSGNYNAMCTGCHLAPGMAATELSEGLYPAPPDLTKQSVDAAEAFWVIKHGIKASGMPAWGKSMDDEYIWNMVAFLQTLPTLTEAQYEAMVASSGGHSHGGGETNDHGEGAADDHHDMPASAAADESKPHSHPPGTPAHDDQPAGAATEAKKPHAHQPGTPRDHHKPSLAPVAQEPTPETVEHRHADGTVEAHSVPQPTKADDGHDHQH